MELECAGENPVIGAVNVPGNASSTHPYRTSNALRRRIRGESFQQHANARDALAAQQVPRSPLAAGVRELLFRSNSAGGKYAHRDST